MKLKGRQLRRTYNVWTYDGDWRLWDYWHGESMLTHLPHYSAVLTTIPACPFVSMLLYTTTEDSEYEEKVLKRGRKKR